MEKSEEAKKKAQVSTEKPAAKKVEAETEELDDKSLEDVSGGMKKLDVKPGRHG